MQALVELIKEQKRLAEKVVLKDKFSKINRVAGVDQAFFRNKIISAIVICEYKTLKSIEKTYFVSETKFPYVSTFLSFREGPAILKTYEKLNQKPDLLLIDGQGIAHPRKAGIASHIGVLLNKPTIGVAKSKLCGEFTKPKRVGKAEKLLFENKQVGWVLKTKKACREIFISPGHKISIQTSLKIVLHCLKDHKLPEPLRLAHLYANEMKSYENNKIR